MKRIILLLLLTLLPIRAHATWAMTQHRSTIGCASMSCAVTGFSAIAAGSFAFEQITGAGTTMRANAGVSGGGTWALPTTCTTNTDCHSSDATAGTVAIAYIATTTGAPTTMTCTSVTSNINECEVVITTFTSGPIVVDVGAIRDQSAAAANIAGTSPGTLTGTNDFIMQGGIFSAAASGCPNSATNPNDFPNSNAACGLINSTTTTAGNYTSTSGRAGLYGIAFKEAAAGSTFRTQVGGFLVGP